MTRDEEIYWRTQPEWLVNAEMERRFTVYFASAAFLGKQTHRLALDKRKAVHKEKALDLAIEKLQKLA